MGVGMGLSLDVLHAACLVVHTACILLASLPACLLPPFAWAHSLAGRDAAAAAHARLECKWAQSDPSRGGAGVFVGWRAAPQGPCTHTLVTPATFLPPRRHPLWLSF